MIIYDLKTQPTKVWRCLSCYKQNNSYAIHLNVNDIDAVDPVGVAEASAEHVQSVQLIVNVSLFSFPVIFCSCLLFQN